MTKLTASSTPSVPFTQSGSSPPAAFPNTAPSSAAPAGPQTAAIHAGLAPDPASGSILTPIYQTATYSQPALGETLSPDGHTYSRCSNPTVSALESNLAGLEGVPHALAFKTGLAAITTLFFSLLRPGDHVVASEVLYGGSVRLLRDLLGSFGVETTFVDSTDCSAVRRALRENTKLLFIESPANPTLIVSDLAALGKLANAAGIIFAVDNTFLTGVLQPVFAHGAHVSVLSTTKYVEGHDSTTGGALLTQDTDLHEKLKLTRSCTGSIQGPFDAWLTLRGLKTLPLRLKRHSASALAIAHFLSTHPAVRAIHYPGLPSSPSFALANEQQLSGGGMLAFELDPEQVPLFLGGLQYITLAENLGAAESLITHPASMTHSQIPIEERERLGIRDGLLRLSVGLEDPEDLLRELQNALQISAPILEEVQA